MVILWQFEGGDIESVEIPSEILIQVGVVGRQFTGAAYGTYWTITRTERYEFDIQPGEVHGPAILAVRDTSAASTSFNQQAPGGPTVPDQSVLEGMFPDELALRFSEGSGSWQLCMDRDVISLVASSPYSNDFGTFNNSAFYGTVRASAYVRHTYAEGEAPFPDPAPSYYRASVGFQTLGQTASMQGPAFPICNDIDVGGGEGEPWEPIWDPPAHKYDPPVLPAVPEAPQWEDPDDEEYEDGPPEDTNWTQYEDVFETAIARWRTRLGIPDTEDLFKWGPASDNPAIRSWNFDVYGTNYTITLDFTEWSQQFALFRLVFNGIVVVWVIGWIYDAIRST